MKTAVIKGDSISISWPGLSGQEWRDALEQVKEIPGRLFDAARRSWTAPVSAEALRLLREYEFSISGDTVEVHAVPVATPDIAGLQKYQQAELLHPYQRHGVGFLLQYPRALLADDMGLGKTAQTIYALALRAAWPALIICPASLKLNWARELRQWAGLQSVVINGTRAQHDYGKITVINYDILQNHLPALKARGYQTVVIEECFPYETIISTDLGPLCIGDIVEYQMDCHVHCYDPIKKIIDIMPITRYIKNNSTAPFVKIKTVTTQLLCTANHKIWSVEDEKYKRADTFKKTDKVLCMVRRPISRAQRKKILWNQLFSEVENVATRNTRKSIHARMQNKSNGNTLKNMGWLRSLYTALQKCFRTNEEKQPHDIKKNKRENACYKRKKWNFACMEWWADWWKWTWFNKTASHFICKTWRWLGSGIYYSDKNIKTKIQCPKSLQNRHCPSAEKNCSRNTREYTPLGENKRARCAEEIVLRTTRVDSVHILEQRGRTKSKRNCQNNTVYNLEIAVHHNYFANDVLVSNCHAIKNPKTARTKAVKAICKGVPNVIAISGTPIVNRPSEFFTVLNILDHYRFPDFWHFAQRYCGARHNGFGWDFSGSSNTEELRAVLDDGLMLRRRKADVLAELPAKTWAVVAFHNGFEDEYQQAREALLQALSGEDRGAAIVMINKLRQIAARAKLADALQWIRGVLDSGQKLVVFAVHHFVIDRIMQEFGTAAVKIDGRDNMPARDAAVTAFQTDDGVRLFVGNIRAAGVGITLTAASNVAFLELPWSPGDLEQAVDRCHRIGQRDAVTAWFLIAEGTIEEQMVALLDSKREQLAALLDGQKPAEDTVLALLLAKIKAENN